MSLFGRIRRLFPEDHAYGALAPAWPSPQRTIGGWLWQGLIAAPAADPVVQGDGYSGPQKFCLINTGSAAVSVSPCGSHDGVTWFPVRYQQVASGTPNVTNSAAVNGAAAPTPAVGPLSVAATTAVELEILGYFEYYKFPLTTFGVGAVVSGWSTLVPL